VFADEAGNFDFSRGRGASKYFILTTVTMTDCQIGGALLDRRRAMAWSGLDVPGHFHASEDKQAIRDEVFSILREHDFHVDATIVEKAKTYPHVRGTDLRFHKTAWYLHMKAVAPLIADKPELLVVASSLGTRRQRQAFVTALDDVINRARGGATYRTAFWSAGSDPCLEVADYCCWAIQRKWERGDERSYELIKGKIWIETDVFRSGATLHY
jgi:hypothetical protein